MLKGKKPFHIKKCKRLQCSLLLYHRLFDSYTAVQKKIELAHKYMELKKSGKLEKFMTKKRKKNARRDRKQLPF